MQCLESGWLHFHQSHGKSMFMQSDDNSSHNLDMKWQYCTKLKVKNVIEIRDNLMRLIFWLH